MAEDLCSRAVEATLNEVLGSKGMIMTGFLGVALFINQDGDRCWTLLHQADGPVSSDLGMAQIITRTTDAMVDQMIHASPEEA